MKKKFAVILIMLAAVSIFAQADSGRGTIGSVATIVTNTVSNAIDPAAIIIDSSITVDTLVSDANAVVRAFKGMKAGTVTLLLLIAAIIKMLISFMKFPAIAGLLDSPKVKPLKPYIALALGILGGFIASISTGQSLIASILAGVTAGFGSVGMHETLKSVRNKNV